MKYKPLRRELKPLRKISSFIELKKTNTFTTELKRSKRSQTEISTSAHICHLAVKCFKFAQDYNFLVSLKFFTDNVKIDGIVCVIHDDKNDNDNINEIQQNAATFANGGKIHSSTFKLLFFMYHSHNG